MVCVACSCVLVKQQTLLARGPRYYLAHDIISVIGSKGAQELSLLRVPHSKHAQEHVLGVRSQLGPHVLDLVNGVVQIFCKPRV